MNTRQRITTLLIIVASLAVAGTLTATAAKKSAKAAEQAKAQQAAKAKVARGRRSNILAKASPPSSVNGSSSSK